MSLLNKSFALGVATYEIKNKKSSIIDACLTKDTLSVVNFEVLNRILGYTSQTCHKLIKLTLNVSVCPTPQHELPKANKFNHFSYETLIQVRDFFHKKLQDLKEIRALDGRTFKLSYKALRKLYYNAKHSVLGIKHTEKRERKLPQKLRLLQDKIKHATVIAHRENSETAIIRLRTLESILAKNYYLEKNKQFNKWLMTLNKHDFKKRTRIFSLHYVAK